MKVITIASNPDYPGLQKLKKSLEHFGYDYDVMIEPFEFGRQMKTIYTWCKANWGQFLYTDAFDTLALGSIRELETKLKELPYCAMLISAEKGCYPNFEIAERYPETKYEWKYVNAGGFISTCDYFVKIYEDGTHQSESNDQAWLSEQFLKRDEILLDYDCKIFQTIAFEGAEDFSYHGQGSTEDFGKYKVTYEWGRLRNEKTNEYPIFIHGNGRTDMQKIYKLLEL